MSRVGGRGPQRDAAEVAREAALAERLREVYREILGRAPEHDLIPSLDRIAAVCELMGDPQHAFDVVHVSGTNGKTSTTRMIERLLREHGLRTGRFVSPHLNDVRERIALDGEPISAERFVAVYEEVLPYVTLAEEKLGGPRLTFFEVLVAMGYAAFADEPVDVAVVEVGMGGAWDATNVADGNVAVLTPIAVDHERFLGSDVVDIATEKSGIVKRGATAVLAEQRFEVAQVLLARAAEVGATVAREGLEFGVAGREVAVGGQVVNLQGLGGLYEGVFLPLHGAHQAQNAAVALAAVEALIAGGSGAEAQPLDADTVRAGFAEVDSPGRMEVVRRGPTVLVDAAHNPAGAEVTAAAVEESFGFAKLIGLVAVLEDKDAEGILAALEPVLDEIVVTRSSSLRALDPDELGEIAEDVFGEDRVHVAQTLPEAFDQALTLAERDGEPGSGILATGSITLAADLRHLLRVP